jgi:hypothetical protein
VAVWEDVIIVKAGGEALVTDGVTPGYSRLHALEACVKDYRRRVRWIADLPIPFQFSTSDFAIGAPTVTGGIVYVTTQHGHVIAIADPTKAPSVGVECSNPAFAIGFGANPCTDNNYTIVPVPAILADVELWDKADAAMMRNEPVIADGRLYVGTAGGHVYSLEPSAVPPPNLFDITVGVTETQTGPDICVRGRGFSGSGTAQITYSNVPARSTPAVAGIQQVSGSGTFLFKDFSQEGRLLSLCSNDLIQQDVTIGAMDSGSGRTRPTPFPAATGAPMRPWGLISTVVAADPYRSGTRRSSSWRGEVKQSDEGNQKQSGGRPRHGLSLVSTRIGRRGPARQRAIRRQHVLRAHSSPQTLKGLPCLSPWRLRFGTSAKEGPDSRPLTSMLRSRSAVK